MKLTTQERTETLESLKKLLSEGDTLLFIVRKTSQSANGNTSWVYGIHVVKQGDGFRHNTAIPLFLTKNIGILFGVKYNPQAEGIRLDISSGEVTAELSRTLFGRVDALNSHIITG